LVRGVYLDEFFIEHFPPIDVDAATNRVIQYNFPFALEMLRTLKNHENHVDPDLGDSTLKALLMFKFNSGPNGISLQAILGKSTEITMWSEVLRALRIFRQICETFIHPELALNVASLLTRVEDLRLLYQSISVAQWVRIFHTLFAKLRGVTRLLDEDDSISYSDVLREIFKLDKHSEMFQDACFLATMGSNQRTERSYSNPGNSPPKKRRKLLHRASTVPGKIDLPQTTNLRRLSHNTRRIRPGLQGESPCYNWICNRAPCFDKAICVVPMPSGPNPKRGRPRPHAFDPVDKAIEAEFRDWVLKYANN